LIRTTELQCAAILARQFQKVISLENHIVEFKKGQRLFAFQPQLDRVKGQHPVDREMAPDLPQKGYIFELVQPLGIVDQYGIGRAVTEGQKTFKTGPNRCNIGLDPFVIEQFTDFIFAGRVANLGRAASHHNYGLVSGLLQAAKQHDRNEIADVERIGGSIKSDIAGDNAFRGKTI
jgi:hypothetical protein